MKILKTIGITDGIGILGPPQRFEPPKNSWLRPCNKYIQFNNFIVNTNEPLSMLACQTINLKFTIKVIIT